MLAGAGPRDATRGGVNAPALPVQRGRESPLSIDAMWHLGVRHIDIPITPQKVWRLLRKHGVTD